MMARGSSRGMVPSHRACSREGREGFGFKKGINNVVGDTLRLVKQAYVNKIGM